MSKIENFKTFNFVTADGQPVRIDAWTYVHSSGWGHKARIVWVGDSYVGCERRITYYNRTWESFQYETVLKSAVEKWFSGKSGEADRKAIRVQIQAIADKGAEECRRFVEAFEAAYKKLTPGQKEAMSRVEIASESQAKAALAAVTCMAAMNA